MGVVSKAGWQMPEDRSQNSENRRQMTEAGGQNYITVRRVPLAESLSIYPAPRIRESASSIQQLTFITINSVCDCQQ
jgi:hypothetical protein